LRVKGEKDVIRPAAPQQMAAQINKKDQSGHDVDIYPTFGVEYQTVDDPTYGTHKGWNTSTGVAADVHDRQKPPRTSQADEKAMVAELSEKSLPETSTAKPVAGYLYFPVAYDKDAHYELDLQVKNETLTIPLPTPAE